MGSSKRIKAKRLKRRMERFFDADKKLKKRHRYIFVAGRRQRVRWEYVDKYIVLWPETEKSLKFLAETQL